MNQCMIKPTSLSVLEVQEKRKRGYVTNPRSFSKLVVRPRGCFPHPPCDSQESTGLAYFSPGWICCSCGPWPCQASAACAALRARTANGGGPGTSKVDASWILGPEVSRRVRQLWEWPLGWMESWFSVGRLHQTCTQNAVGRCPDELWQLLTW